MRKAISVLFLIILVFIMLSGCSSNKAPALKKADNLKTYDEVYKDSGLKGAIDYFDANFDQFSEEKRKSFADKVSFEVSDRGSAYAVINDSIPEEPIPAPRIIENVDWFYPNIYSSKDNTFNLSHVEDPEIRKAIDRIKNDDVFILTKAYWISDDNIEDSNFRVVMHPDTYRKVEKSLEITYVKGEYGEYATKSGEPVSGLEGFFKPTEVLKAGDLKWESDEKYPKVYVETPDKIELMRGAWKTEAYLPVKIID